MGMNPMMGQMNPMQQQMGGYPQGGQNMANMAAMSALNNSMQQMNMGQPQFQ